MKQLIILILFVLLAVPIGIWIITSAAIGDSSGLLFKLSQVSALLGTLLLGVEFILGTRFKIVEEHFGQDKLVRWHHSIGIAALILVFWHGAYWLGIYTTSAWGSLGLQLGVLSLGFLMMMFLAIWSFKAGMFKYEVWRNFHFLNYLIFPLAYIHSILLGTGLRSSRVLQIEWLILGLFFLVSAIQRIINVIKIRQNPYQISLVWQETHDVWMLELKGEPFEFLPGQYLYLHLIKKGKVSPGHPFTIISSPAQPRICLAIKASGDFTKEIAQLKTGDLALIDGPYGRFSYFNYAGQGQGLVFIAGGIGITPFLSMLRSMREERRDREIWLIWGNKTVKDIAFQDEFEGIKRDLKGLKVVHVLSEEKLPDIETGFIDAKKVSELVDDLSDKEIFICGPTIMMRQIIKGLRRMNIPNKRIHAEKFLM